jgi:FtsZ-binding cell division protein ZapB
MQDMMIHAINTFFILQMLVERIKDKKMLDTGYWMLDAGYLCED